MKGKQEALWLESGYSNEPFLSRIRELNEKLEAGARVVSTTAAEDTILVIIEHPSPVPEPYR